MNICVKSIIARFGKVNLKIILCLMASACAGNTPIGVEYPTRQDIRIIGYEIDNFLPVHINFSVRNSSTKTICLYRSLFESNHTYLYGLRIKYPTGKLLQPNPVGYIDEMPSDLVAIKPGEVKTGSLGVGGYSPPKGNNSYFQANFYVFGAYCEHDMETFLERPDFIIESGWFALETTEQ